jgi:hypothetical protein
VGTTRYDDGSVRICVARRTETLPIGAGFLIMA